MPFCLPGVARPSHEKSPLELHESGVLAYAVENTLVFVDTTSLETLQTLTKHPASICCLTWQPPAGIDEADNSLKCASADSAGNVFTWDVLQGKVFTNFSLQNQTICSLRWLNLCHSNGSQPFLMCLHSKNVCSLFNAFNGVQLWQAKFGVNVFGVSVDPFDSSNLAFSSQGASLVLAHGLSAQQPPQLQPLLTISSAEQKNGPAINQLVFHRAYPHRLFVLLADKLVCVHTEMKAVIFTWLFDSPGQVVRVLPCAQRDAFYTVSHGGQLALRVGRVRAGAEEQDATLLYEKACSSEVQRQAGKALVRDAALAPLSETHVALLFTNGRLLVYSLRSGAADFHDPATRQLSAHIHLDAELQNSFAGLRLSQHAQLKAWAVGMTVVRMRPMNSAGATVNSSLDQGLLAAVATAQGSVYVVNVLSCEVVREFQVHSCTVKCLEWGGSELLITAGCSLSLSSSTVRNDLFATDIRTGQRRRIRPEAEESPIELIRVSHYHSYLAVAFRHEPLEIWDIKSMRLLRRMSKRCPIIVDVAWFGKHTKSANDDGSVIRENLVVLDVDNHLYHVVVKGLHVRDGKEVNTDWTHNSAALRRVVWKDDVLVFGDTAGQLKIWDLAKKRDREMKEGQTGRGPVLRLVFSPLAGDYTLAVQYQQHLVVWDVESMQLLQVVQLAPPGLGFLDVDMCGVTPVYLTSTGALMYGAHGEHLSAPVQENDLSPALRRYLHGRKQPALDSSSAAQLHHSLQAHGLAELAHLVPFLPQFSQLETPPPYLCMFWPPALHRKRLETEVRLLMSLCERSDQVDYVVELAVVLEKHDWASCLLMNFENSQQQLGDIRPNAFKACLLSANRQAEDCRCLIKMIATSLIASNRISDGVQLLYMIDQKEEACKYLLSQGQWTECFAYLQLEEEADEELLNRCFCKQNRCRLSKKAMELLFAASRGRWDRCAGLLRENGLPEGLAELLESGGEAKQDEIDVT